MKLLTVLRPGPLSTVQDLGRIGYAHLGVPRSGALDPSALLLANRLTGNPPEAAGIEMTYGGLAFQVDAAVTCALVGAPAGVTVNGRPAGWGVPIDLPAGATLAVAVPADGLRGYLAVAGGIVVDPVLGSRSTDTLSGLGPAVLRAGAQLPLGRPGGSPGCVDVTPWSRLADPIRVRVRLGPRDGLFADPGAMFGTPYVVAEGDRVGLRLRGAPLVRDSATELPSEGLVAGAIQVPPDGQPLIFLADHPTTGGYPVVGVTHPVDRHRLAQARPGARVVFHGSQRGPR
jgi:biotin-dependent carboxylase-like uncharacterized protein